MSNGQLVFTLSNRESGQETQTGAGDETKYVCKDTWPGQHPLEGERKGVNSAVPDLYYHFPC